MSEAPIIISNLNDFIFCPASIYFHSLETEENDVLSKDVYQLNGSAAHKNSDTARYSTRKNVLQGISVYSAKYDLSGKIDTFDAEYGILTERKNRIKTIYDGYVFQLYAQYFALIECGYEVKEIRLYSMEDNKVYKLPLPEHAPEMLSRFEGLIDSIKNFSFDSFVQGNVQKCMNCIYASLCSFTQAR